MGVDCSCFSISEGVLGGKPVGRKSFRAVPPFFVSIRQATLTLIITIMKALRFLFLSLLAAFSFAASAQTIEVYKDGRVIDSFSATQVDSVVYAPAAAQPRYYYYAGWDCPNSVEDLENFIIDKAGKSESEGNGKDFIAGYVTTLEGWDAYNPIVNTGKNTTELDEPKYWYVFIPEFAMVYVDVFGDRQSAMSHYIEQVNMSISINGTTYRVYKSDGWAWDLNDIIIG